jgi:hypothetical protein
MDYATVDPETDKDVEDIVDVTSLPPGWVEIAGRFGTLGLHQCTALEHSERIYHPVAFYVMGLSLRKMAHN